MQLLKCKEQKVKQWSGGQTIELAIFPTDGDYSSRNFIFRISTAKVEVFNSEFTSLPGFHRSLMVLEGELTLIHHGLRKITLCPFQMDEFEGEWITTSEGIATDFNVMTSDEAIHQLTYHNAEAGEVFQIMSTVPNSWCACYILNGAARVSSLSDTLSKGDFLIWNSSNHLDTQLYFKENTEWIQVEIKIISS